MSGPLKLVTLATHVATRYVQPLREGGSLPAVVDTQGGGMFADRSMKGYANPESELDRLFREIVLHAGNG